MKYEGWLKSFEPNQEGGIPWAKLQLITIIYPFVGLQAKVDDPAKSGVPQGEVLCPATLSTEKIAKNIIYLMFSEKFVKCFMRLWVHRYVTHLIPTNIVGTQHLICHL